MKFTLTILIFFITAFLYAQQNLIPNGDFEDHQGNSVSLWEHAQPPFYHYSSLIVHHSGKYSIGLCIWKYDPTEYFQIKLNERLEKGVTYELKMSVNYDPKIRDCLNDSVTELGCCFSDTAIFQNKKAQLYTKPQIVIPVDKNPFWVEKKGCFKANGDENYLIIGKFFDFKDSPTDTVAVRLRQIQIRRLDSLESEREKKITDTIAFIKSKYETDFTNFDKIKDKDERENKLREYRSNAFKSGFEIRSALETIEKQYAYDVARLKMENYCRIRINIDDISLKKIEQNNIPEFGSALVAGEIYRLKNVFFETDKSYLLPKSFEELDKLFRMLKNDESMKIEISGHTDTVGNDGYNQHLSEMRAKAVLNYLISKGIDKSRIFVNGYGSSKPVTSNDTEEGRAKNRRVEFKVLKK